MSPSLDVYRAESDGWHPLKGGSVFGGTPSDPPGGSGVFGDPGPNNVYIGSTIGGTVSLSARETFYTKPLGIYHTYWNTGDGASALISAGNAALNAGRIPLMSCKFPNSTWAEVAAGAEDTFLNALFNGWGASGKGPYLFAPHSEPNGDGQPAANYLAMCLHIMGLASKSSRPQILLVPILAAGPSNMSGGLNFSLWMSNASCDLAGFNTYNHLSYNPDNSGIPPSTTQNHNYSTVSQCLDRQIDAIVTACGADKKWIVGEYGTRTVTATANTAAVPGKAAQWMSDFYDKARTRGAYGICFFDSNANVNDQGGPWTLDDTTDTSDGTERKNQQKTNMLKSTSKYIPLGGIAA